MFHNTNICIFSLNIFNSLKNLNVILSNYLEGKTNNKEASKTEENW